MPITRVSKSDTTDANATLQDEVKKLERTGHVVKQIIEHGGEWLIVTERRRKVETRA